MCRMRKLLRNLLLFFLITLGCISFADEGDETLKYFREVESRSENAKDKKKYLQLILAETKSKIEQLKKQNLDITQQAEQGYNDLLILQAAIEDLYDSLYSDGGVNAQKCKKAVHDTELERAMGDRNPGGAHFAV